MTTASEVGKLQEDLEEMKPQLEQAQVREGKEGRAERGIGGEREGGGRDEGSREGGKGWWEEGNNYKGGRKARREGIKEVKEGVEESRERYSCLSHFLTVGRN